MRICRWDEHVLTAWIWHDVPRSSNRIAWTTETDTDLEFLATSLRTNRSAAGRDAVRRAVAQAPRRLATEANMQTLTQPTTEMP